MGLHKNLPTSPHEILLPEYRWFPADETLRAEGYGKLLPPLVDKIRRDVQKWRGTNYAKASVTSRALLNYWFKEPHIMYNSDGTAFNFKYYFAQREALETLVYLNEVVQVKDCYDLMRFDSTGGLSASLFAETWNRYIIKMATGSGKTKVMSLVIAWSYFHRLYEADSEMSRNFLVIAPNIIVLDRLLNDFSGLRIFFSDPVIPDNGYEGQNWKDDFQLTLHVQDNIGHISKTGNIFLTNIHRVYDNSDVVPSFDDEDTSDYFMGIKPRGQTTDSKLDLGVLVREVDEIAVLNDEAHHVHDEKLAWNRSIEDIHNKLRMKGGKLAFQVDVTATPRHNNGNIFVQTVSDYPLVEAIYQNVVKHPVIPDEASRAKLVEQASSIFTEKYRDFLHLGFIEWKKAYDEHIKLGKKAILFVMTDDTKNCDEVAEFLCSTYPELNNAVLTIHTKNNGEISESGTGKKLEELTLLRKAANEIDSIESPYKAIVSVLMLKEGWDVRNVTTIVGLRAYSAKSNVLPEQTLGRGLRRMYQNSDVPESLSVVGTQAFLDFVASIEREGVTFEHKPMGLGTPANAPIVIEVDKENKAKDLDALDIEIPVLTPRIYREYKNLSELEPSNFKHKKVEIKTFSETEQRDIIFRDTVSKEISHITNLDTGFQPDFSSVIGYFTKQIMAELNLFSGFDILYGKVKSFIRDFLFTKPVDLDDLNVLRNLSEVEASRTIRETFKKSINELTVQDKGEAEIKQYIKAGNMRPFQVKSTPFLIPKKSVLNKITGDSHLELEFAAFLERCFDVVSFIKNCFAVSFKIDYQNADGDIKDYYPDFVVKLTDGRIAIIETKGREDLDDIEKIKRLQQWCEDVNKVQRTVFFCLYVREEFFKEIKGKISSIKELEILSD